MTLLTSFVQSSSYLNIQEVNTFLSREKIFASFPELSQFFPEFTGFITKSNLPDQIQITLPSLSINLFFKQHLPDQIQMQFKVVKHKKKDNK